MSSVLTAREQTLLDRVLLAATDTRCLQLGAGVRRDAARTFVASFGDAPAIVVADPRTYAAAGAEVTGILRTAGIPCHEPFVFPADVWAEHSYVEMLQQAVASIPGILVAVGSGTVNDLTKLVGHRRGQPYMLVATAASMDGYTACGASISQRGAKSTLDCPAPRVVLADLEIIAQAPGTLNAAGYADLLAKGVAGADWILADAAGEEPIDAAAWTMVQEFLPTWIDAPQGISRAEPECLRRLMLGLLMSGFAMQVTGSSRPASGAEHQFSHLWDMQHHTHSGVVPLHGHKVGLGTLASLDLYELILQMDIAHLDISAAASRWPSLEQMETRIHALLGSGALGEQAIIETRAKYVSAASLRTQLERLHSVWPDLRTRLRRHLLPFRQTRAMLCAAGCPSEPQQIGITPERLRFSYEQAYYIRRRYTVLDLARRLGILELLLHRLFAPAESEWSARMPSGLPSSAT
jgi:glycerol-1-phosphate dehydrogenase [NAD(P)+]